MYKAVKLSDTPELIDFLANHEALTLAVPIDGKGTTHAAAMLFYNTTDPFRFYFVAEKNTEKFTLLDKNRVVPCAVVVGTERHTPFSLQMRGELRELDVLQNKQLIQAYYEKLNNHYDDVFNPKNGFLEFTPKWARFIDYSKGYDRYLLSL